MNEVVGVIGIGAVLALAAAGMPIAFAMILVGFTGFSYLVGVQGALTKLSVVPFMIASSYDYSVIPLFMLMAFVLFEAGFSRNLFNVTYKWLAALPGGIAIASVGACAIFAAVSASSMATAATMGLVAIPEMKRLNYDSKLATGCIAAGGTMGILIPPSGILILYGILTEQSIGKLFMAGVIPGVLEAIFYMITIYIMCKLRPELGPRGPKTGFREKITSLKECADVVALICLALGGLFIGWFTPSEAGAVAACGAIVLAVLRKRFSWAKLWRACVETLKTTGMIYAMLIGAFLFNFLIAASDIPTRLADFVGTLSLDPMVILLVIFLIYMLLGCFLDALAMVLLTLPIFYPMILNLGFNPIWFGIFIVRVMEIGMITPPVGLNVYVIAGLVKDVPMSTIFKGIMPFLTADICHVMLLLFVPQVALFLPNLAR
jgi:C4-dicarboxylate transporter DctM subunit